MRAKKYDHEGQSKTLAQWAAHTGISLTALRQRAYYGWTVPQMLGLEPSPQEERIAAAAARKETKRPRGRPRKE